MNKAWRKELIKKVSTIGDDLGEYDFCVWLIKRSDGSFLPERLPTLNTLLNTVYNDADFFWWVFLFKLAIRNHQSDLLTFNGTTQHNGRSLKINIKGGPYNIVRKSAAQSYYISVFLSELIKYYLYKISSWKISFMWHILSSITDLIPPTYQIILTPPRDSIFYKGFKYVYKHEQRYSYSLPLGEVLWYTHLYLPGNKTH